MDWAFDSQQQFNQVLSGGISAELSGCFSAMAENARYAPNRYNLSDVRQLAQLLVCRNYSKTTLELAVLVSIMARHVTATEQQLLRLLYPPGGYHHSQFKFALQQKSASVWQLDSFTLHPNRLGLLQALLEFLLLLDGTLLRSACTLLQQAPEQSEAARFAKARQLASHWQKMLYQYLEEHLPAAQLQRRYRAIADWLGQQTITDDSIFSFWLAKLQQSDDSLGFRRYRTAAENMLHYALALQLGQAAQQEAYASPLGDDPEQGEYLPERLQQALQSIEPLELLLLAEPVKCITRQQQLWLDSIAEFSPLAPDYLLTLVRLRVLGDWQAQCIQASRLQQHPPEMPQHHYQHWQQSLAELSDDLTQTAAALGYILLQLGDSAGLSALNAPQSQCEQWQHLADPTQEFSYQQALRQAKQAFSRINRQGFRQLPAPDELASYQQALGQLQLLQHLLSRLQARAAQLFPTAELWQQKFQADLSIIQPVLSQLSLQGQADDQ